MRFSLRWSEGNDNIFLRSKLYMDDMVIEGNAQIRFSTELRPQTRHNANQLIINNNNIEASF